MPEIDISAEMRRVEEWRAALGVSAADFSHALHLFNGDVEAAIESLAAGGSDRSSMDGGVSAGGVPEGGSAAGPSVDTWAAMPWANGASRIPDPWAEAKEPNAQVGLELWARSEEVLEVGGLILAPEVGILGCGWLGILEFWMFGF